MVTTERGLLCISALLYLCLHQQFCSFHKLFVSKEEKRGSTPFCSDVYCSCWSYIWDKFSLVLIKHSLG